MQLIINGQIVSYSKTGSNLKVILCLHGWADNGKTFDSLTRQLSDNYTIVSVDLPGFGGSEPPKTAWGLDDYGELINHFIQKLELTVYAVIGHSNGGAIAIRAIASEMISAEKLILIASAGIRTPRSSRNRALLLLSKPAKLALKIAPKKTQHRIKDKVYKSIGSDYMIAEHMQEIFKNIVATDVLDDAKKITIPTCLIYGEDDTDTPPEYGQRFAEHIPTAQLNVIEASGHFVHNEQVYQVAPIIKEFLK